MSPKPTTLPITSISRTISFKNQNANPCFQIISSNILNTSDQNTKKSDIQDWGQRDGPVLKSCSRGEPTFNSQQPCGGSQVRDHSSQPAATPVPTDPTPLFWFPQVPDLFIAHIQIAGKTFVPIK